MSESNWKAIWNADLVAVICENCDSAYLVPEAAKPQNCPNCYRDELDPVEDDALERAYT